MKKVYQLNTLQQSLLNDLLDRFERGSQDRMISIRVSPARFPEYFSDENPGSVRAWEDGILQLVLQGWIAHDLGVGAEKHRISRIRLEKGRVSEIIFALKRISAEEFRKKLTAEIENHLEGAHQITAIYHNSWLEFLNSERRAWEEGLPKADRRDEILEDLSFLYRALFHILSRPLKSNAISWRQFSAEHFANSKRLDLLKEKISQVLARDFLKSDGDGVGGDENAILSHFGIWSK